MISGRACFRGEAVHRLKFYHFMAERADDSPATRGCPGRHGDGAKNFYPRGNGAENRCLQKGQRRRQMIEIPRFRSGKKSQRNNAHGFLGVIASVRMRHPGRAKDLQLPENGVDRTGSKTMKQQEKSKHHQSAEKETSQRRCNHRDNHLGPEPGVPLQHRPISMRSRDRGAAQSANERMARARRQANQPGGNVPREGGDKRA